MTLLYICIFILSFASLSNQIRIPPGTKDGGGGFSSELIHSYSPLSPFYNPNITAANQWASINLQSSLRLKYFEAITNSTNSALQLTDDGQTPVILVDFHYLIKLSIGTPPKDALLSLDTGSTLVGSNAFLALTATPRVHQSLIPPSPNPISPSLVINPSV